MKKFINRLLKQPADGKPVDEFLVQLKQDNKKQMNAQHLVIHNDMLKWNCKGGSMMDGNYEFLSQYSPLQTLKFPSSFKIPVATS